MTFKNGLWAKCTVSAGALAVFGLGDVVPAMAQVEELIVTAQRREQSLQDVPIAVSAFTGDFLSDAGVDDILELQFFTPGLVVANNQSVSQTSISIRGVGTAGNSISLESSVGLYIDGVYRSRQTSAISDLVDIERVEILKGPQGTLFGRNTASGAVQYITVAPQPEFGGWLEASYGNLDYKNFKGALNLPIVEDKIATRISGSWTQRDGYVENLTTGTDLNDKDRYQVRGQALFTPNENVSFKLIGDYSKIDEVCCSASNWFDGPADTQAAFIAAHLGNGTTPFVDPLANASYLLDLQTAGGLLGVANPIVLASQFDDDIVRMDIDPFAQVEEWGLSGELSWDINGVTFTSITAYRSYEDLNGVDADFSALSSLSDNSAETDQKTFTQEFRLNGNLWDRLEYVVGAYYFDQSLDNEYNLAWGPAANVVLAGGLTLDQFFVAQGILPNTAACLAVNPQIAPFCALDVFPAGTGSTNISTQEQESWAIFGQGDYSVTEQLILTLGLRYNSEKKNLDVQYLETDQYPGFVFFQPFSIFQPNANDVELKDETVTGTAKVTYFWTPELMTYVSYGRGYKSGGTNTDRIGFTNRDTVFAAFVGGVNLLPVENFVVQPILVTDQVFDPEVAKSWEVGLKGAFFEGRLQANLAAFTTKFDDFQANTFVGTGFVLQNAGAIKTQGVEIDLVATPTDWLTLSGGGAYIDATYDSFTGGACTRTPYGSEPDAAEPGFPSVCDNSGNIVPGTPEWSFVGSARVERPIVNTVIGYGQLDVRWNDDRLDGNDNDPNKFQEAFTLVNLRVGAMLADERIDVSLWSKNLLDQDYQGGSFNSVGREGSLSAYHTEPRTYGITVRGTF